MQENKIDVMWDDRPVDVTTEVNFIWSIANKLRGTYQSDKYKDVIIPMTIIRRFECALEKTKEAVVKKFNENPNFPPKAMNRISGYSFYNTSPFSLKELLNDSNNIASNFKAYIAGFSANVQDIIHSLDFEKQIDKMDANDRLYNVVEAFSELDLDPATIDNVKMGYIFEDLIRRFSENAEAGDHYTGRDIIKLMVNILLAEGCPDIFDDGKVITVLDQACGTGGMLSTSYNYIRRLNPTADVRLFGQEINPESYAICLAEMLIKGQNAENIRYRDTMKEDCFSDRKMRFVIENPRLVRLGAEKTLALALKLPLKKNTQKEKMDASPPDYPAAAICSFYLYNLPLIKWTMKLAEPRLSKTAAPYLPEAQPAAKARLDAGFYTMIYWRPLLPCQPIYFITPASQHTFGYLAKINAKNAKARCS